MSGRYSEEIDALSQQIRDLPKGGGYAGFTTLSALASQREHLMYLNHDCYGEYGQCISCGCSKGRPCVSHKGSRAYTNELLERIAGVES